MSERGTAMSVRTDRPAPAVDTRRRSTGGTVAIVAGLSVLAVVVGGVVIDPLWLALVPATALIFVMAGAVVAGEPARSGRAIGAVVLRIGSVALLATAAAGFVNATARGVEPAWLGTAATASGVTFAIGALVFGFGIARARLVPRGAARLFALAIPIGLAVDFAASGILPVPLFFAGAGVYVGLGLLAVSLLWLGNAERHRARND